jgi:uncharacterized protein YeaO (DUF488 family)
MLRQGSIHQLRTGAISREDAHIAVCMCFYPRNLPKTLRDEYRPELAPDRALFKEWQAAEKKVGHNEAFTKANYVQRFPLGEEALAELERLSKLSRKKKVYLLCQCAVGERCHRELLLLTAQALFGAKIGNVYHSYPGFEERLTKLAKARP